MTREIKFTPFGIPYVLEFGNVSFAPSPHPRPPSPSSSFCYVDGPPTPPRPPLFSLFKRKPARTAANTKPLPPPPQFDVSGPLGICIQFSPECGRPPTSRKQRLVHLQQIISTAVLDAGMSRSPANTSRLDKDANGNAAHDSHVYRTPDALFCGTYGQMMAALEGAGLSATLCSEENSSGYTRLGALFVARTDGASGVQLREITLWG